MMKVIAAIDEWAADFETRCTYKAAIGPVLPKVNIDAIQGGILVSQRTLSSGSNSTMRDHQRHSKYWTLGDCYLYVLSG